MVLVGMILSFAKVLKKHNINYQHQLLVEATDISSTCAYMAYIQLSLYGIPAVVYCGNTISGQIYFKMETPLFFLQYWKFREFYINNSENTSTISSHCENKTIAEKTIPNQNLFKEIIVKGNNQISLW